MTTVFQLREVGASTVDANDALSKALNQWFTAYGPTAIFKSCANCRHMSTEGPAVCALFKATPPASVIVAGCPSHEDSEDIPF